MAAPGNNIAICADISLYKHPQNPMHLGLALLPKVPKLQGY
jgi:hypothetical protein